MVNGAYNVVPRSPNHQLGRQCGRPHEPFFTKVDEAGQGQLPHRLHQFDVGLVQRPLDGDYTRDRKHGQYADVLAPELHVAYGKFLAELQAADDEANSTTDVAARQAAWSRGVAAHDEWCAVLGQVDWRHYRPL